MDRNVGLVLQLKGLPVALRKESVDRNQEAVQLNFPPNVALRKESVDRNPCPPLLYRSLGCRSPQGERG